MMRRLFSAAVSVLLLTRLAGCTADLGKGLTKEYEDYKEGIHQELIGNWERGIDNYIGTYEIKKIKIFFLLFLFLML